MLGIHSFWFYGILLRVIEFIEIIFFVLRKKHNQVTFLHIYHHISKIVIFGFFSSTVEVSFHPSPSLLIFPLIIQRHDGALSRRHQLSCSYFYVHILSSQFSGFHKEINEVGEAFCHRSSTDTVSNYHWSLLNCDFLPIMQCNSTLLYTIS